MNSMDSIGTQEQLSRELRKKLRELRIAAGYTQELAAADLNWSRSKVLRIEGGHHRVTVPNLKNLLRLYGVVDEDLIAELVEKAHRLRRRPPSPRRGVPAPLRQRRHKPETSTESASHYELLQDVNNYVVTVLEALQDINKQAGKNNHLGIAAAVDNLVNLTRRDGDHLKRLLTTPSPSADASGADYSSPADAT